MADDSTSVAPPDSLEGPRTGHGDLRAVGIVIPSRNSGASIARCLQSVLETIPDGARDVIVVDSGSTDDTPDLVRMAGVRLETIRPGYVSRSRNIGAALVRSDLLAFVDSDCVLLPGWYEAVMECLAHDNVAAAGCRYELRDRPTWVERSWLAAKGGPAPASMRDARYVPGGNLVVRREAFAEVGGFDETMETGEDMQLCAAITARGRRVVEYGAIRSQHLGEPRTLVEVFWRNRWHGRGARLNYADGRMAAITLSTIAFAGTVAAGLTGAAAAIATRRWIPAASLALAAVIPAVYATRYTRSSNPADFARLCLIYFAYFCGRSAALPDVVRRRWAEILHHPIDPLRASSRPSHRHAQRPAAVASTAQSERLRDTNSEIR